MSGFDAVLVANRGEIAARILRSVRALGLRALLVAHADDVAAPALALADDVRFLTGPTPVAAFLDGAQIIAAALDMGAGAIHPGYGFLAENADFAAAVAAAGLVFIGPPPEVIRLMGDKVRARAFVAARGFPVAPGVIEDDDPAGFAETARGLGAPLLIKPSAGGGGKGMRIVRDMGLCSMTNWRGRGRKDSAISAMAGCLSNAMSNSRAISRCRCSAMPMARSCICSNANARCNAASRRSSRKRRARRSMTRCARAYLRRGGRHRARRRAIAMPARSNSSWGRMGPSTFSK